MSNTWKKLLSLLLALTMVLSLGIPGFAADDEDDIVVLPEETEDESVVPADESNSGTELELEEIDPSTLSVPKLGEMENDIAIVDLEKENGVIDLEDLGEAAELPYGLNDIVRVSIFMDEAAALDAGYSVQGVGANSAAVSYRDSLKAQQAGTQAAIEAAGVSLDVVWNLTLAVNLISANVRYGDIAKIEAVPGVKRVVIEQQYQPCVDEVNTSVSTGMIGASAAWADGYTGAGSRVAIIDTGIAYSHQSFNADAFEHALTENGKSLSDYNLLTSTETGSVLSSLNAKSKGATAANTYISSKIPFAYNYVDNNTDISHDNDDASEHGSHVAGIAAANRYIKSGNSYVDAASTVYAVGVAPDAQLVIMKVFGSSGGAYDSDYMAAIEDAIVLGCDSANLSLGSSEPGFTFSDGYQDVMDTLANKGMVVSVSAGNAYGWNENGAKTDIPYLYAEDVNKHTGGSPGSFVNSLAVAAAQNTGSTGTPLNFDGTLNVFYNETSYTNHCLLYTSPSPRDRG